MGRILVVDDSEDVRGLVTAVLQADGHQIDEVASIAEAEAWLDANAPDAIVADIDLPDGDGMSLIPSASAKHPATRVVVITGDVTYESAVRALHTGAYDFIPKPISREDLRRAVGRAVESRVLESENRELVARLASSHAMLERRVTERTAELRLANERLAQANRRLEETRDQMVRAEKMASIGCIAAGVAHEINNPIGFINSNLQTLKGYVADLKPLVEQLRARCAPNDPLQDSMRRVDLDFVMQDIETLVRESEDGVRRVVKIVKDLKTYSRSDDGKAEETNLQECIEAALSLSRNETKYVADIVTELQQLPKVKCWPVQITQVLVNLIVNAAQAIEGHGTIWVRSRTEGEIVAIEVADSGCGIQPENLRRIFDPFFTTKDPGKGTGLGLSLSWEIVERHGGEIHVASEPGRGTTFTVRLPVRGAQEQPAAAA